MSRPETHFHLDHLPPIDQFFINEANNATYSWPSIDYKPGVPITTIDKLGNVKDHGVPIATPSCTRNGIAVEGERHTFGSRTISQASSFITTQFAQDVQANLGHIKTKYLYNAPWSLYDWHQDLAGHKCCVNFLLTDTPGARTIHKFPTDCKLNFQVETVEYNLYYPLLFNTRIDHCVINMTDQHRYILQILLFDVTYDVAKEYLSNYALDSNTYL
jgi:hypothetical protein